MHKDKKIVLLPMTPTEIVQFENEKKNNAKQKGVFNSENQQPIKLNNPVLFATKSDLDELSASIGPCYVLVCKHALYSIEVASIALPPAVAVTTAPVLAQPNSTKPFDVYSNASRTGLGCVLMQNNRVIAYASRALQNHE
jgi:hypothetical protein